MRYPSTITPQVTLDVTEPRLDGVSSRSVARFVYRDETDEGRTIAGAVHLSRGDTLNAAADLLELAGLRVDPDGEVVAQIRKEARTELLVTLTRGDMVRWLHPEAPEHEQYAGCIAVVVTKSSQARSRITVVVPALGENGSILVARNSLGNPLDYDDNGEKLTVR